MKNKKVKIIDIIFWGIIIIVSISSMNNGINNGNTNIVFENINLADGLTWEKCCIIGRYIFTYVFVFLSYVLVTLLQCSPITVTYFGAKIAYKKYYKDKLDISDFVHNDYYRDLLPNFSPGVLSYINDFKLNKKDIVATLLSLELKKNIKIGENIQIINENDSNLTENEKYIFKNLKSNSLKNIDMLAFERAVFEDCQRKKLLRKKGNLEKNITNKKIIAIIIYICIILGFFYFPDILNGLKLNVYIALPAFIIMVFLFILIFTYPMIVHLYLIGYQSLNKLNPYIRNKKAKEINIKLNGLKKFLNEYSQIEEKKKDDLILWEEYLIYSIIFDINDNVVKEVMGKI